MRQYISRMDRKENLLSIQVFRGLTALGIAAFHTSIIMARPQYGGIQAFGWAVSRLWMGVNLFFVLSGFIIVFAHGKDIGRPARLGGYAWRRICRVYPVYWIFLTGFVIAALAGFGPRSFRLTWGDLGSAYMLVRWVDDSTLPLKVAWTLLFEVSFYAMFATLITSRPIGTAVFALWLAAIFGASFEGSLAMGWTSMWNINFFYGAAAFWLYRRLDDRWGVPVFTIGLAMLVTLGLLHGGYDSIETQQAAPFWLMLIGVPFALLLLGAVLVERRYRRRPPAILLLLGEASFATYLVHSAVISAMCQILHRYAPGELPPHMAFVLTLMTAMLIGVAAHMLVERPVLRLVKRIEMRRRRPETLRHEPIAAAA
ncbi:acyltransferase [Nostoc sp. 3335mG]|nr:acyltransferase [Nostoc sp. 3335mG]